MDKRKIAIFDSGVGGLTTLKYLQKMLPDEDYVYFGDYLNNPYGTKTTEELQAILKKNVKYLESLDVKIIVIACNTAGTQVEYLRTITSLPLLEPITVTAQAINNMTDINSILVLATNYTINVGSYQKQLANYQVLGCPAQELVKLAEEKKTDQKVIDNIMKKYQGLYDMVVLGCTHFGYFEKEIQEAVKPKVIVESSFELAKNVVEYLKNKEMLSDLGTGNVTYIEKID